MSELPMEELAMKLQAAVEDFDGLMGVSVNDLASGDEIGVNWDEHFLAASSIKIPILIELFRY
jgi:beta-lactamase class A